MGQGTPSGNPATGKRKEIRFKVDDLRGSCMSVGILEELIHENHAIVSSSVGPDPTINGAMSMHNKVPHFSFSFEFKSVFCEH